MPTRHHDLIYNHNHRRQRALLAPQVETGTVRCVHCGELIKPGEPWHLGHSDIDPSQYGGPEHVRCNCAVHKRFRPQVMSRRW